MALYNKTLSSTQNQDEVYVLGYASAPPEGSAITLAVPFDFTGSSAVFSIYQNSSINSVPLLILTSGGGNITFGAATIQGVQVGTITVTMAAKPVTGTPNTTLPAGSWYYDLLVTQGGVNVYYASGPFVVEPSVSR